MRWTLKTSERLTALADSLPLPPARDYARVSTLHGKNTYLEVERGKYTNILEGLNLAPASS